MDIQIVDWNEICYFNSNQNEDNDNESDEEDVVHYIIQIFGKNIEGESVCLNIHNVYPYVYLKEIHYERIEFPFSSVYDKRGIHRYEYVQKKDYKGFTNDKYFQFLKIYFKSSYYLTKFVRYFRSLYEIYEGNSGCIVQYMHDTNVSGNSFICLDESFLIERQSKLSKCDREFNVVDPYEVRKSDVQDRIVPLRIMSYDIEVVSEDGSFPVAERKNDKIIQIGMTFNYFQDKKCYKKILINLGSCDKIDGVDVIECRNEYEVLENFVSVINREDPDVICGYNIFGFDNKYIYERAKKLHCSNISTIGRLHGKQRFVEKELSSSALGDNILNYYETPGRVQIDLMKVIFAFHNLEKYSLDFVSSHFTQNEIVELYENRFYTSDTEGIENDCFLNIKLIDKISNIEIYLDKKIKVKSVCHEKKIVYLYENIPNVEQIKTSEDGIKWCLAKDDITPNQIFEYFEIDSYHRSIIGKYCIKDCTLVNSLMEKLDVLSNSIAMANVCNVPLSYIFTRGQGVKAYSLIKSEANKNDYLFPIIQKEDFLNRTFTENIPENTPIVFLEKCTNEKCGSHKDIHLPKKGYYTTSNIFNMEIVCVHCKRVQHNSSFEGAYVKDPIPGYYTEPIIVMDFASLYPNSIIQKNMSGETQILDEKYLGLPECTYENVEYKSGNFMKKCCFVKKEGKLGIIPQTLKYLLETRALIKKKMKGEKDKFKKKILDGQQLAMKITANSIYGQTGALTSPIYLKDIAACTTRTGKEMINMAEKFMSVDFPSILVSGKYKTILNKEKDISFIEDFLEKYSISPTIIYGDTDSTFVSLNIREKTSGKVIIDRTSRYLSIEIGKIAEIISQSYFPSPQKLEYEKVYHKLILLCKKKYCGRLYENNPDLFYINNMGIVLKRRDNAKIVKKFCGSIMNIMFTEDNYVEKTREFLKKIMNDLRNDKFDISYFALTKSLRGYYKGKKLTNREYKCNCGTSNVEHKSFCRRKGKMGDPGSWFWDDVKCSIAHVNLCQRMKRRDPGSAPNVNDRISYVHVKSSYNKNQLQGDKIEELEFFLKNKCKIDYDHYIDNQIKNPCIQFLELFIYNPETLFRFETDRQTKINSYFTKVK